MKKENKKEQNRTNRFVLDSDEGLEFNFNEQEDNNIQENKRNKKQLLESYIKKIVKKTLNEVVNYGNQSPLKKSNRYKFASKL